MAKKKLVLDDAQLARIKMFSAGNGKDIFPVSPEMKNGDTFSSSLSRGRSGKRIEDEVLDDEVIDVAATEEATPADNVVSDPEQLILLAKTDVSLPPTPNTTPVTVGQKGIDLFSSQTSNWWAGGVGLATVGTGVGFALSRDDSNNTNDPVSAISDSNVAANSVAENATTGTVVGITTLATDAGDTISYSLSDNAGGRFAIDATTGVITVADGTLLDYESTASHAVTVLATSSDGSTSSQQFSIDLSNVNDNPISAISDSNVATDTVVENSDTGTVVGITALATDADAGATISYSLSDNAGGRFAIDATTGVITVADGTLLDFETVTSHDVTVLATSSDGSTNSQQFTINVSNDNDPVSVISDSNLAVNSVAESAITGTVVGITALATDADVNTTISYILSDNAGGRFAIDAATGVITVADGALLDYEIATSHAVTVLATSSDGSTNNQQFIIDLTNINDNPVSAISDSNLAAANVVAENAANGTVVGITALAADADTGATISFSLSDNAGGRFAIDATSGVITVADGTLLNSETATSHDVTVLATSSDGSASSQQFTVNVSNVNDNLVSAISDSNGTANFVAENAITGAVVGITALATDADADATVSYSLSDNAGGRFAINATSGVITVADSSLLDYESATSHAVIVLATSSDGSTSSQQFTVNVSNVNDNLVSAISDSNGTANSVAENAITGTVVGITALATDADAGATISFSLSDDAAGRFAIDSTGGVITVADGTLLDYESATSHAVTVLATSTDGSTNSQQFTVNVSNVNDNPVSAISDSNVAADSVVENSDTGTVVGITALATDADAGATISFSLSDDAAGRFAIDASGAITVADGARLDSESATSHDVTVLATSTDGSTNSQQFTVNVSNVNDNPVSAISDSNVAADTVAENAVTGTVVGITALATDADAGATISYSLSDDAGGRFTIDATNGAITVADGTLLDYESVTSHDVTVLATSSDGSTNSQQFTISLTNVNEHFVVEASGAWIDLDADGVRDAEDATQADFSQGTGNIDLTAISGVIHFNNVPDGDLNLAGFGTDDRIEIDAQAFIDNGHHALNILSISGIKTLDEFRTTGGNLSYSSGPVFNSFSRVNNAHALISNFVPSLSSFRQTGTYYSNSNSYSSVSGSILSANVSLNLRFNTFFTQRNLRFFSSNSSSGTNAQLASGLPTDMPLQDLVDFVNLPVQPVTTHVVVDQDGAVIDIDGDGVRDNGENRLAVFADGGNADLSNKSVVVHFNDIPMNALNLSGFGTDDKIEINTGDSWIVDFGVGTSSVYYRMAHNSGTTVNTTIRVNQFTTRTLYDFNSNSYSFSSGSGAYAISVATSGFSGAIAYWTDAGNALNNQAQLLPDNFGTSPLSHTAVLGNLNANHYPGLVEFVWPVNVVVDDQAGNVATFIDANANGVRDTGEDTLALLGQTQADVDAFNAVAGTSYGSQAVDLASEQVSIHYNDLPTGAWVPDMTGFNGNDRIEIDVAAMLNNIAINDTVTLNNQPTRTMSSQTQFYAGASGVSSGNTAVYLSGGNLKFGQRATTTSFTGSATVFNTHYTATGTLQGVIASNAGTIGNNFQQVAFVTSII